MNKEDILVILGTAHRRREPGKHSPDGKLLEYLYSRELCADISAKLHGMGYNVETDFTDADLPKSMQSPRPDLERSRELDVRVDYVNERCRRLGAGNVLYVSLHVDASHDGSSWREPNGWSVRVSPFASHRSRLLADCLFDAASVHGLKMRQPTPKQKYWEQSLYVLNNTLCPAVLTENLFQDNRDDVSFLLSDDGLHCIERLHLEGIINYLEQI